MENKPTGWTLGKNKDHLRSSSLRKCAHADPETRALTSHEIDAMTAALTGYLYLEEKTELLGDEEEGYVGAATKGHWRRPKL